MHRLKLLARRHLSAAMSVSKKILKHPVTQYVASWVLAGFILLVKLTNRLEKHIHPDAQPYMQGEKKWCVCLLARTHDVAAHFLPPEKTNARAYLTASGWLVDLTND